MIALLVLLIIAASLTACVYFAYSVPPAVQELASFCSEKLSATETRFWAGFFTAASRGAAIGTYVCSHGLQDFKISSIALAAHCVFIFTFTNGRRLLKRLIRFVQADPNMPVVICFLLVPITVIASFPQLHWIFWLRWYYESYRLGCLPSMRAINWHLLCFSSYLSSTALTHFVEITVSASPPSSNHFAPILTLFFH
ncbi:hypothetical protein C8R43DRAFT_604313 [Mycena crocata]|nr:hypothetical protein C8R43DRAFT_604313 [Mycena crocata]